jgi:hypothetical protein
MTDNFDIIRNLLEFKSEDDFYFLQILQRKKDHKKGKVNGTNNNSRLIKPYYIGSLEYFDFIKPEVIELCKVFNARAGFNLNKRSYKKSSLQLLKKLVDQQLNEDYNKANKAYSSVVGNHNHETDKKWILDVDEVGRQSNDIILFAERYCFPEGNKFITTIPSKNGYHIIMKPFDLSVFKKKFPDVEVHKNNPTNLYIP